MTKDCSRREFVKKAAYVAPVILTLQVKPALAGSGSAGSGGGGSYGGGGSSHHHHHNYGKGDDRGFVYRVTRVVRKACGG